MRIDVGKASKDAHVAPTDVSRVPIDGLQAYDRGPITYFD
jgi:hypothetical protein